jgi:hypothetical protein
MYDQKTSRNEEAKGRYRAVENTTTMDCNGRKTNNKQVYNDYASVKYLLPDQLHGSLQRPEHGSF